MTLFNDTVSMAQSRSRIYAFCPQTAVHFSPRRDTSTTGCSLVHTPVFWLDLFFLIFHVKMPAKSRLTRLDAFTKTVEDARIRTTSGGIVTIASLLIVFYLVWGEWSDYRRVVVHPELIVDKGRGNINREPEPV